MTAPAFDVDLFAHLEALTDVRGIFEHASGTEPRRQLGYCTDDNARLLVVAAREGDGGRSARLGRIALAFTLASQRRDGRCHNRRDRSGQWTDGLSTEDCWGRSVWGLGTAAATHADAAVRARALTGFEIGAQQRSRWPHAMAFAALGAADVVAVLPGHPAATALLRDAAAVIGAPGPHPGWTWPLPRLSYANAALAEAVLAAGNALGDGALTERGLAMLGWLLERESASGHLSVTPTGGRGPGERGPAFDQQPIEVAAMADACWRAHRATGDRRWAVGLELAGAWFAGANDAAAVMWDAATGGGFDGLHPDGVNRNEGAESTLAFVSTVQRVRALERAAA